MKWVAQFLIRFISNLFRWNNLRSCRYAPTCSEYGIEAFHHHSFLKAAWLTLARVCRCHPFSAGGYDPVGDYDGERSEAMRMPLSPTGQASVVKNTESGV